MIRNQFVEKTVGNMDVGETFNISIMHILIVDGRCFISCDANDVNDIESETTNIYPTISKSIDGTYELSIKSLKTKFRQDVGYMVEAVRYGDRFQLRYKKDLDFSGLTFSYHLYVEVTKINYLV